MSEAYNLLSGIDASQLLSDWRELCEREPVLSGRRANVTMGVVHSMISEIDVEPDCDNGLPHSAVVEIQGYAEAAGSGGVALRQLPLLAHAFAWQLPVGSETSLELRLRAQMFVESAMVMIASRSFSLLDGTAHRDELTGLANKRAFSRDLARLCEQKLRPIGMVFADIDGLKRVNDTQGHDAGNEYIKSFAAALSGATLGRSITAYRWAGDEHALLTVGLSRSEVSEVVENVRARFESFSSGYASIPEDADDAATLEALADELMYKQKKDRKRRIAAKTRAAESGKRLRRRASRTHHA